MSSLRFIHLAEDSGCQSFNMIPKSSSPRSNEVIENAPELPIQQNPYSHFAGVVPFSGHRDREALTERKFKGSEGFVANG
jgi:hypothetical protein